MSLISNLKNTAKTKLFGRVPWEEQISINSFDLKTLTALPAVNRFFSISETAKLWVPEEKPLMLSENIWEEHVGLDPHSIPPPTDREGYYGENHLKY